MEYEGEPVSPPTPVLWYPDQLAWSMTTPKNVIRRFPPFASFQKFLVSENSVGNITRQEVVSMIPPLLLDVKPGMAVLDLCAAPGSKSAQLIEMIHGGEEARLHKVLQKLADDGGRAVSPSGMQVTAEEGQAAEEEDYSDDGRATGLLIANDVEYRRAQMLVHQCKRLNSPNVIVTNHDAIMFPSVKIPSETGTKYLKFDRILADVPCSGDGTCRKNFNIWKDWIPGNGLGLHVTQVRILVRALQMLKVGGRVVYSTCSMNPIENEAVVASAIERCGGSAKVRLVDKSDSLPGLKRRAGLKSWKVMDKQGRMWSSWEEVIQARTDSGEEGMSRLSQGMFPPAEGDEIALDRCIRVYPHLQDTGGFFICSLEKLSEIKAKPENAAIKENTVKPAVPLPTASIVSVVEEIEAQTDKESNGLQKLESLDKVAPTTVDPDNDMDEGNTPAAARQNRENAPTEEPSSRKRAFDAEADAAASIKKLKTREEVDVAAEPGAEDRQVHWPPPPGADLDLTAHHHTAPPPGADPPKRKVNGPHEEPFKFLDPQHPELLDIYKFYDIADRFPRDRFMVRNASGQPVKAIYYTSALAQHILTENEGKGLKFVHCGVKMFVKQDVQGQDACRWRIQSEGLPIVEPWVGECRIVRLRKRETLRKLLIEMFPRMDQGLAEIGDRCRSIGVGCCLLRVEPSEDEDGFKERLVMPLWRGISSLNLMVPKEERKAMLLRLFNDDSELVDHQKDRLKAADKEADNVAGDAVGDPAVESAEDEEEGGVVLDGDDAAALGGEDQLEEAETDVMGEV